MSQRVQIIQYDRSDNLLSGEYDPIRLAFGAEDVAALVQEHGNTIVREDGPIERTMKGDGLVTDRSRLILTTRAADCQSFVLYAPRHHVAGVLHVGWRGVLRGAMSAWIEALKAEWNILPHDVYVGAGPSLCLSCADFSDPVRELPGLPPSFIHGRCVDLRGAVEAQCFLAGVLPERFERMKGCTRCDPATWWTYRGGHAAEVKSGRTNVLAVMLA